MLSESPNILVQQIYHFSVFIFWEVGGAVFTPVTYKLDVCRGAGRLSRVPRSRSQAVLRSTRPSSQVSRTLSESLALKLFTQRFFFPTSSPGRRQQATVIYTKVHCEARGILIRWVTLTIFTHLDYAHMCAFKFCVRSESCLPAKLHEEYPSIQKSLYCQLYNCDSKCSLICEGTIKLSSPEPTIAKLYL